MKDQQTTLGLSDDELADHPTVFAADALAGQVVVVSGGAGGIGRDADTIDTAADHGDVIKLGDGLGNMGHGFLLEYEYDVRF